MQGLSNCRPIRNGDKCPRQDFIFSPSPVSIKRCVQTVPFKCLCPYIKIKMLFPPVEARPTVPCFIDGIGKSPVTP